MRRWLVPVVLLTLAACDSKWQMVAQPAQPVLEGIRGAVGQGAVMLFNPQKNLPADLVGASRLEVAIGSELLPVVRHPDGTWSFSYPVSVPLDLDADGRLRILLVWNGNQSRHVLVSTASPVPLADPALVATPSSLFLGMPVKLSLATNSAVEGLTWNFATSQQGPWVVIAGSGREVTWTPPQSGNYYVRAVFADEPYTVTSTTPLVKVGDSDSLFQVSGASLTQGQSTRLTFGLTVADATWSYGPSAQGPWSAISQKGNTVRWFPPVGSHHLKVDTQRDGKIETYVSSEPRVIASENQKLITANNQTIGEAKNNGQSIYLKLNVPELTGDLKLLWSVSTSSSLGWSTLPYTNSENIGKSDFEWEVTQPQGTYFVRVDVQEGNSIHTFVSPRAVVVVTNQ